MLSEGHSLCGRGSLYRRRKGSESQDHGSKKRKREAAGPAGERVKQQHRWKQECEAKQHSSGRIHSSARVKVCMV